MEEMIGEIADFPATLEIATLADIPQLNELLTLLFTQEADFCPDPENQCAGLQRIIADPGVGHILTLKRDSKIFGMVNLLYTVSTALGETVAILEDMIVHPDYRGGGEPVPSCCGERLNSPGGKGAAGLPCSPTTTTSAPSASTSATVLPCRPWCHYDWHYRWAVRSLPAENPVRAQDDIWMMLAMRMKL